MTEGMVGMRVGGKRKIAMPYNLAFGEQGNDVAPPKAMVVCDISVEELVGD
jgi:peptidylprolyl isomerase